jgi:serine O-acetyltransferase
MNKSSTERTEHLSEHELDVLVKNLCNPKSYEDVYHISHHGISMPSSESLAAILEFIRSIIFPGFYLNSDLRPDTMPYYMGSTIDRVFTEFTEQIKRGFCFSCGDNENAKVHVCEDCVEKSRVKTRAFLSKLPSIRKMLSADAMAAFTGDPAAHGIGETVFCYPSVFAMTNHRIAHELYNLEVPLIPRMISEMAHSRTGIDIHPGASIGESFFIDHGTGTVIGETSIIGKNVRIYQGVTLGAKSFPIDLSGNLIKGIPRHPIVEDNVVIYSGATILGRIRIGEGAEIGGNVWVTRDVPAGARIVQSKAEEILFDHGLGI